MPSLLTHAFFADDIVSSLPSDASVIGKEPDTFRLGSQGPDPLFYGGVLPKRPLHLGMALKKYGNKLHQLDGTLLFKEVSSEAELIDLPGHKSVFVSFIFGQFAHYLLDSTCHPYIFYWSGFDKNGALSGDYHYAHAHFEARIDSSLAFNRGKEELIKKPWEVLSLNEDKLLIASDYFTSALTRVFKSNFPKRYYRDSVYNMRSIYHMTNKKDKEGKFLPQLHLPRTDQSLVLNEEHNVWMHPVSGEHYEDTFTDLYQQAKRRFMKAYASYLNGASLFESINSELNGKNYNGIIPGYKMLYKDKKGLLTKE